ncbi:carbonic anhydrase 2-like [Patiria miniata]|uniref:Carbonic anhydrase n=1 Tax=Patiria miniata TaxID=46514 RepID=A0A913ZJZ7_PATMI|nr:carbonic anhydrase 2-like [Patiria miniata]XP_038051406.1 carbonic anhydrase 2-like [Patiria miniata]XP_038051407.1 carbonic anhydrase 2-like [Patiria miniata]
MAFLCLLAYLLVALPCANAAGWIYSVDGEPEWGYGGGSGSPFNWVTTFPDFCSGQRQSPINIDTETAKEVSFNFLNLQGFCSQDRPRHASLRVENNGHSVELHIHGDFFINEGGLPGKQYKVEQLHYHWGNPNAKGSEHAINGRKFDAEMHFVTYDTNYTSITEAKNHVDGVAVFAAMLQVGVNPHFEGSTLDEFISGLPSLGHKGDSYTLPKSQLKDLRGFLPDNIDWFYRYRGSFTTPHCDEHVIWSVWEQPIVIPQSKMNIFYNLYANNATDATQVRLMDNYRPLQEVNGRAILHSHRNNW